MLRFVKSFVSLTIIGMMILTCVSCTPAEAAIGNLIFGALIACGLALIGVPPFIPIPIPGPFHPDEVQMVMSSSLVHSTGDIVIDGDNAYFMNHQGFRLASQGSSSSTIPFNSRQYEVMLLKGMLNEPALSEQLADILESHSQTDLNDFINAHSQASREDAQDVLKSANTSESFQAPYISQSECSDKINQAEEACMNIAQNDEERAQCAEFAAGLRAQLAQHGGCPTSSLHNQSGLQSLHQHGGGLVPICGKVEAPNPQQSN